MVGMGMRLFILPHDRAMSWSGNEAEDGLGMRMKMVWE